MKVLLIAFAALFLTACGGKPGTLEVSLKDVSAPVYLNIATQQGGVSADARQVCTDDGLNVIGQAEVVPIDGCPNAVVRTDSGSNFIENPTKGIVEAVANPIGGL